MKTYEIISGRNFHERPDCRIRPLQIKGDDHYRLMGLIAARTLDRIFTHYCGVEGCRCASGPATVDAPFPDWPGKYWVPIREITGK